MSGLLLALLLVQVDAGGTSVDAGETWDAVLVYRATIDTRLADGGVGSRVVQVGGCWLNEAACQGSAAELERRRAEKQYEDRHVDDLPQFKWLVGLAAAGFALGAASVVTLECAAHTCFGLRP